MMDRYPPSEMGEGYNDNGEESIFFISNPGLGLWAVRERLTEGSDLEGRGLLPRHPEPDVDDLSGETKAT